MCLCDCALSSDIEAKGLQLTSDQMTLTSDLSTFGSSLYADKAKYSKSRSSRAASSRSRRPSPYPSLLTSASTKTTSSFNNNNNNNLAFDLPYSAFPGYDVTTSAESYPGDNREFPDIPCVSGDQSPYGSGDRLAPPAAQLCSYPVGLQPGYYETEVTKTHDYHVTGYPVSSGSESFFEGHDFRSLQVTSGLTSTEVNEEHEVIKRWRYDSSLPRTHHASGYSLETEHVTNAIRSSGASAPHGGINAGRDGSGGMGCGIADASGMAGGRGGIGVVRGDGRDGIGSGGGGGDEANHFQPSASSSRNATHSNRNPDTKADVDGGACAERSAEVRRESRDIRQSVITQRHVTSAGACATDLSGGGGGAYGCGYYGNRSCGYYEGGYVGDFSRSAEDQSYGGSLMSTASIAPGYTSVIVGKQQLNARM